MGKAEKMVKLEQAGNKIGGNDAIQLNRSKYAAFANHKGIGTFALKCANAGKKKKTRWGKKKGKDIMQANIPKSDGLRWGHVRTSAQKKKEVKFK